MTTATAQRNATARTANNWIKAGKAWYAGCCKVDHQRYAIIDHAERQQTYDVPVGYEDCMLIGFERREQDNRNQASGTWSLEVPSELAHATAVSIERHHVCNTLVCHNLDCTPARGHGITVVYPDGKRRNVEQWS